MNVIIENVVHIKDVNSPTFYFCKNDQTLPQVVSCNFVGPFLSTCKKNIKTYSIKTSISAMFGAPEKLPEHEVQTKFWNRLTQFAIFTASTAIIVYGIRHVERKAFEQLGL